MWPQVAVVADDEGNVWIFVVVVVETKKKVQMTMIQGQWDSSWRKIQMKSHPTWEYQVQFDAEISFYTRKGTRQWNWTICPIPYQINWTKWHF